jgi:hypothetical protein
VKDSDIKIKIGMDVVIIEDYLDAGFLSLFPVAFRQPEFRVYFIGLGIFIAENAVGHQVVFYPLSVFLIYDNVHPPANGGLLSLIGQSVCDLYAADHPRLIDITRQRPSVSQVSSGQSVSDLEKGGALIVTQCLPGLLRFNFGRKGAQQIPLRGIELVEFRQILAPMRQGNANVSLGFCSNRKRECSILEPFDFNSQGISVRSGVNLEPVASYFYVTFIPNYSLPFACQDITFYAVIYG